MGGHSIGIIPMAISLCASFNSAYMILGMCNKQYTKTSLDSVCVAKVKNEWRIINGRITQAIAKHIIFEPK